MPYKCESFEIKVKKSETKKNLSLKTNNSYLSQIIHTKKNLKLNTGNPLSLKIIHTSITSYLLAQSSP
jgi:hypothetical protein